MKYQNPPPPEIKKLRGSVQDLLKMNITAAQDWCADSVHTSSRSWQQWEHGDRKMHAAFWELINIKYSIVKKSLVF